MRPAALPRNDVDGVLLLNKPRGLTSQQAVTRIKRLFAARKAGHTGTLDPLADGLLPVGLGEATKFTQFLLNADKRYLTTLRLGVTTTTGDAEGDVVETRDVVVAPSRIAEVLRQFVGPRQQTPPMYSALKVAGKPLYVYARTGESVPRQSRMIHIKNIQLIDFKQENLVLRVDCSKGTYIRVLAEELGAALGCGAHLTALTREGAGGFDLGGTVTLDRLESLAPAQRFDCLLPTDAFARDLPALVLDTEAERRLLSGQAVACQEDLDGACRLYGVSGRFLGVGQAANRAIVALRLLAQKPASVTASNSLSKLVIAG